MNAHDPDGNSNLLWSIEFPPDPQTGTVTLDSSGNSTTVYFEPEGNYTGSTFFSIRVSEAEDQNASDLIYFNVEVEPIEDSPVFESYPSTLDAIQGYSWQYEIFAVDGDSEQDLEITTESTLPPWLNLSQISKGRALLFGTPFNGQTETTQFP